MDEQTLLKNANNILSMEEGINSEVEVSGKSKLTDFVLPGMLSSKNTLGSLYKFEPASKRGVVGKIKQKILTKMKNIVLNVVERESMKQQKFNELTYNAIDLLNSRINELDEKIKSLEQK